MIPPAASDRATAESTPGQEQHDAWAAAPVFRRYVGDAGAQVHLYECGSSEATPVVLLHRSGASAETWLAVGQLGSWDVRLLAPDLPGCGQSDALADVPADDEPGAVAAHLLGALRRTEHRPLLLVAEMDAICVAVEMARAEPASTTGVVLVAPSVTAGHAALEQLRLVDVPVWVAVGREAEPGLRSTTTEVPGARWLLLPGVGSDPVSESPDLVLDLVHGAVAEVARSADQSDRRYMTCVSSAACENPSLSR
ncbi:Alpha/beta hydrolase family protein [Nocardioides dokdonensis FR1436]|uniref:Alpha/beta hydrolase family protein n=1 Tax=Nocardioides dokdonensis FR1436 TaxID=1300347 RepID=A0A1A9GIU8_9ACTN|nr:alpha/beta hydrolase [Nocardioides dokdonensis]ANH38154.1 Alpha/beta hydrolase family protein [Nocardioides dokdonensis FR1436]